MPAAAPAAGYHGAMTTHLVASKPDTVDASFRVRLTHELAQRCARNARYSLRAFANYLGIDHASLSQLMRGRRALTATMIRRLARKLGLSAAEIETYVAREANAAQGRDDAAVRSLAADAALVLGDWLPFAILELMRLAEFRPDVRWIARMLGVEADRINIALQHLIRLGFLDMAARGQWIDRTQGSLHREEDFAIAALERLAQRSRELQLASARNAPDSARVHGALTLAVKSADLPRLLARVERFVADMHRENAADGADALYHLDVHFMPLTNPAKENDA
jgi:uncharacterized protein (TIGR02147 family)